MVAEDRDLVVLLKSGDAEALEQLITRWRSFTREDDIEAVEREMKKK